MTASNHPPSSLPINTANQGRAPLPREDRSHAIAPEHRACHCRDCTLPLRHHHRARHCCCVTAGTKAQKIKITHQRQTTKKKRPPPHHTSTHPGLSLPAPKHHHEAGAVIRSTQIDQLHRALSSEHFAARRHDDIDAPHTQHRCALGTPTLSLPGHATIAGIVVSGDPEASSGLASDQGSTHS